MKEVEDIEKEIEGDMKRERWLQSSGCYRWMKDVVDKTMDERVNKVREQAGEWGVQITKRRKRGKDKPRRL